MFCSLFNNRAINNGMNVKSNFRNGGKNGTAKLKKDRSSAITASIPLSEVNEYFFVHIEPLSIFIGKKITAFQFM